jgi:hypothetical protein
MSLPSHLTEVGSSDLRTRSPQPDTIKRFNNKFSVKNTTLEQKHIIKKQSTNATKGNEHVTLRFRANIKL